MRAPLPGWQSRRADLLTCGQLADIHQHNIYQSLSESRAVSSIKVRLLVCTHLGVQSVLFHARSLRMLPSPSRSLMLPMTVFRPQ
jgi:hypothetical protein